MYEMVQYNEVARWMALWHAEVMMLPPVLPNGVGRNDSLMVK